MKTNKIHRRPKPPALFKKNEPTKTLKFKSFKGLTHTPPDAPKKAKEFASA